MRFSKPQLLVIMRSRGMTMTTNGWEGVEARLLVTIELWPQISITNHHLRSHGSTMVRTWSAISLGNVPLTAGTDERTHPLTHGPHLSVGFLQLPHASNLSSEQTHGPAALPFSPTKLSSLEFQWSSFADSVADSSILQAKKKYPTSQNQKRLSIRIAVGENAYLSSTQGFTK